MTSVLLSKAEAFSTEKERDFLIKKFLKTIPLRITFGWDVDKGIRKADIIKFEYEGNKTILAIKCSNVPFWNLKFYDKTFISIDTAWSTTPSFEISKECVSRNLRERVDYYLSKALTKHQADLAKKIAEEAKSEQRKSFESWLQGN
jgi:hypothetical protein